MRNSERKSPGLIRLNRFLRATMKLWIAWVLSDDLSDDLSRNCHVDYVIKKANTRLYAIRTLKKAGLSRSDLVNIYCSFIRLRIEYAFLAWSSLTVYLSDVTESILKRALRIIYQDMSYEEALIRGGSRGSQTSHATKVKMDKYIQYMQKYAH